MEGNPFPQLLGMMKEAAKGVMRPSFRMGVVQSPSPLSVRIAGLTYQGAELLVNDLLTAEIQVGEQQWSRPLEAGDPVVCLPLDGDDMRYLGAGKGGGNMSRTLFPAIQPAAGYGKRPCLCAGKLPGILRRTFLFSRTGSLWR